MLRPRRRLAVQLADDHGVLCCDLDVDRDWRAYFCELWTTRRFKWDGSRGAGAFSVGAMVRFRPRAAVWKSNLQPYFNVCVCDSFDASSSAVLRELDESNRSVQKSAESTSI